MLVVTADTLPEHLVIEEILGPVTVIHPIELRKGIIQSFLERDRNELKEAHSSLMRCAKTMRGSNSEPANLVYGLRVSTCVAEGTNGPQLLMTLTATAAIFGYTEME